MNGKNHLIRRTAAVTVLRPFFFGGVLDGGEGKERMDRNSSCLDSNDKTIPAGVQANSPLP